MTRVEVVELQAELKTLTKEFGQVGHDRTGGPTAHYVRKALNYTVPDELRLMEILAYYRKLKEKKEVEKQKAIEKAAQSLGIVTAEKTQP
jgi:hypothetical protein